ncbi:Virginiamycin B lyase [Ralstonia flaminis]|jgi:sugar lactone lactonase YvrE|uniref:Virginiamycin B lyase n=2 Tax=Ralstonia flaminis TaxID=3058597 RepID=A0ABM9K3F4_9RALS|nr:Virginiamycin B lyase [Ralstonia sp. LMG 18101]
MFRYPIALSGALLCASTVLLPACGGDSSPAEPIATTSPATPLSVDSLMGLDTFGGGSQMVLTANSAATWSLTGPGSLSATQGTTVTYMPPPTVPADTQVTITAVAGGTTVSKTITVHAAVLNPVASQVTWYVGDAPIALSVSPQFTNGAPIWSAPNTVGALSGMQGHNAIFTPGAVTSDTPVVISVAAGGRTESVSIMLKPASEKTLILSSPSVQAGGGSVTLTVPSTISHGTLKWMASVGNITVNADGSATYTPPATLSTATVATISATDGSSAPFSATISVMPSATLSVSPSVAATTPAGAPVSLTATIAHSAATVQWALTSGRGSLSASTGATVTYTPDPADTTINDVATVTATAGSLQQSVKIILNFQSTAQFDGPLGMTIDGSGNLFVSDGANARIRKITPTGVVSTFAGSGTHAEKDGAGTAASFVVPVGITADSAGNLYVADIGQTIRKITPAGVVTTLAGPGPSFSTPNGIAVDTAGNVYVVDSGTNLLLKITPAGVVATLAGSGANSSLDGTGTAASFNSPQGLAIDGNGTLYVAEGQGCHIRKVTSAGVVTTLAGSGVCAHTDGTGTAAAFNQPKFLVVDGNGNIYVTENKGQTIRKVTAAGVVTTLAGSPVGTNGSVDGLGINAQFDYPAGITMDSNGNLYVADNNGSLIRMITPAGNVSTLAGIVNSSGYADGTALPRQ